MDTFRLSITAVGLIDVEAASMPEALALAKALLEKGGLRVAGKPVLNVSAALNPVVRLDQSALKPQPTFVAMSQSAKKPDDHKLEVHGMELTITNTQVN